MTKPSKSLHNKLQHKFQSYTDIKTRLLNSRTCYWAWTTTAMGGPSSLPTPGERSNSDSSGPSSLLWSPWVELGGAMTKVQILRLNTNPEPVSQISQLKSYIRSSSCSLSFKTPSLQFPFFPMNSLKCIPPEWFFSWKIWAASALYIEHFYKIS